MNNSSWSLFGGPRRPPASGKSLRNGGEGEAPPFLMGFLYDLKWVLIFGSLRRRSLLRVPDRSSIGLSTPWKRKGATSATLAVEWIGYSAIGPLARNPTKLVNLSLGFCPD